MNRRRNKGYRWLAFVMLLSAALWSGCAEESDPDAVLDRALDAFAREQGEMHLQSKSGLIAQSSVASGWHPLLEPESFRSQVQEVRFSSSQGDAGAIVIDMTMTGEGARTMLRSQLASELEAIRQQAGKKTESIVHPSSASVLQSEVQARLAAAEERLDAILQQSEVTSRIRMWIDRGTDMPGRVDVETTVRNGGGADAEPEAIAESYRLSRR